MRLIDLVKCWSSDRIQMTVVLSDDNNGDWVSHQAPTGDFLAAYIGHLMLPWWKTFWWQAEWRHVEKKMRQILNDTGIVSWAERE